MLTCPFAWCRKPVHPQLSAAVCAPHTNWHPRGKPNRERSGVRGCQGRCGGRDYKRWCCCCFCCCWRSSCDLSRALQRSLAGAVRARWRAARQAALLSGTRGAEATRRRNSTSMKGKGISLPNCTSVGTTSSASVRCSAQPQASLARVPLAMHALNAKRTRTASPPAESTARASALARELFEAAAAAEATDVVRAVQWYLLGSSSRAARPAASAAFGRRAMSALRRRTPSPRANSASCTRCCGGWAVSSRRCACRGT